MNDIHPSHDIEEIGLGISFCNNCGKDRGLDKECEQIKKVRDAINSIDKVTQAVHSSHVLGMDAINREYCVSCGMNNNLDQPCITKLERTMKVPQEIHKQDTISSDTCEHCNGTGRKLNPKKIIVASVKDILDKFEHIGESIHTTLFSQEVTIDRLLYSLASFANNPITYNLSRLRQIYNKYIEENPELNPNMNNNA